MTNPLTRAFFIGRATATLISERAEAALSDFASEIGKTLADVQQEWDSFGRDVMARAAEEEAAVSSNGVASPSSAYPGMGSTDFPAQPADLQASLDELRAEVAQLRSELNQYRSQST